MSNKFLGSAINNDYAREVTLEAVEDTLTNGILKVNVVGGGGGGGDVNLIEIGGTNTAVSSGNTNLGTQRVIIATDDPNLSNINTNSGLTATNTLNIRSDTQLISADTTILSSGVNSNKYDTNQISILGTNIDVNSGNTSLGTQRMIIATDDPNLSNINTNIGDISVDTGNIDTNISNINTTVDDNGLEKLNTSDRFYVYNEVFPTPTSKMNQVPTEEQYVGWNISGGAGSRILTVNQEINNHSRYLVWETTLLYPDFASGAPKQCELTVRGDSLVNQDNVIRIEIDAENNNLEVGYVQQRNGQSTELNLVIDSDFNIDKLDGSGPSKINVKNFNVKYTFKSILDICGQNLYYQIYSPSLKRFSTFHVFNRNTLTVLDSATSGNILSIQYDNVSPTPFYVENYAVYLTENIDIDIKNLERYNLRQIQNNDVPLLESKQLSAYDDDLEGGKILGSASTGNYNLKLIETALGEPCSIVTSNNLLQLNYEVEIKYYITNSTNIITTEVKELLGQNAISLNNNCYRVISMRKISSSTNSASGDIFIFRTADGSTSGIPNDDPIYYMRADYKQSLLSQLYVPPNRKVFLNELSISQNIFDGENITLFLYNYFDNSDLAEFKFDLALPIKENFKINNLNLTYEGPLTLEFKPSILNQIYTNNLSLILNYIEKKLI